MLAQSADQPVQVTVVDVGHGSATLFRSESEVILVDTGRGVGIVEFLRRANISHIDCVVISHADQDHVGGLIAMISTQEFTIATVVLNSDGDKTSDSWRDLAYELDDMRRRGATNVIASLREDDLIPTETEGLEIRAVAPRHRLVQLGVGNRDASNRKITSNSMSGVLLASFNSRPIALVTGDMDALGWDHLRDIGSDLRADVLVIPHHGGWGGTKLKTIAMTLELCERVEPRHVFVSNGRGSHGTPRAEVVAAVRRAAPQARIACTQVSDRCLPSLIPRPIMISRSPFSTGARGNSCCAGSIDVTLLDDSIPVVDLGDHEAFVDQFGTTALCRS